MPARRALSSRAQFDVRRGIGRFARYIDVPAQRAGATNPRSSRSTLNNIGAAEPTTAAPTARCSMPRAVAEATVDNLHRLCACRCAADGDELRDRGKRCCRWRQATDSRREKAFTLSTSDVARSIHLRNRGGGRAGGVSGQPFDRDGTIGPVPRIVTAYNQVVRSQGRAIPRRWWLERCELGMPVRLAKSSTHQLTNSPIDSVLFSAVSVLSIDSGDAIDQRATMAG